MIWPPYMALELHVLSLTNGTAVSMNFLLAAIIIVFRRQLPILGPEARRLIIAQEAAAGDPPQERSGT